MNIYPVFIPEWGCSRQCIYCDQKKISATDDPSLDQALPRIKAFIQKHRNIQKQVAFYGGSFTALDQSVRQSLIDAIAPLLDDLSSFRISTRPDAIDSEILTWCTANRIRTIELGIQDFSNSVLLQCQRPYDSDTAHNACDLIKTSGLELGVQLMPGLPGWTQETLEYNHHCLKTILPQYLRLYPTIVIRNTALHRLYARGGYTPLSMNDAIIQCADYQALASAYDISVIKLGIPSTLDPEDIIAGPYHPAFGELVKAELVLRNIVFTQSGQNVIFVDRRSYNLLMSHGAYYYKILCNRIGFCTLKVLDQ